MIKVCSLFSGSSGNCIFVSYRRKYWFLYENKVILLVNNARKPFNVFEYTKHLGPIKE